MKFKANNFLLIISLAVLTQLLMTEQAQAEIFKCVNLQGKVFYNDKPCPVSDKETQIESVADPKRGTAKSRSGVPQELSVDEQLELERQNDPQNSIDDNEQPPTNDSGSDSPDEEDNVQESV